MIPTFDRDFDKQKKFVAYIAISADTLEDFQEQFDKMRSDMALHGKPIQGVVIGAGTIRQVITPFWNGKKY